MWDTLYINIYTDRVEQSTSEWKLVIYSLETISLIESVMGLALSGINYLPCSLRHGEIDSFSGVLKQSWKFHWDI